MRDGVLVENLAGAEQVESSGNVKTMTWIAVRSPGRYRVSVPCIEGYQPVEPFEVEIPRATFVDREIQIRRR
jgi:hypothetical protein